MDSTLISQDDDTQRVPVVDPTAALVSAHGAQQCTNCAAPLAVDQRYCLECGERNGAPRLPVMSGRPEPRSTAAAPRPSRTSRVAKASSNTALIAGVGTLLVALGVGVLIGKSSEDSTPQKASGVQVVTVSGAAGGAAVAGATPSSAAPGSTSTPGSTDASAKASGTSKSAAKDKAKASSGTTAPASGAVKKTSGKVVKVGTKGHGPGYKDGKFTGDFFGG
ncbi:MAG TPA: hypothetical protein VI318_18840 [Baekduia sp.]